MSLQPAGAADAVSFRLDWTLSGYHLPFYWAKEKGYYGAENLDVDIKEGAGSGKTRTLTYRVAWLLHQGAKPWDILDRKSVV